MIWLSWRQFRIQALVGGIAALLVAAVATQTGRTLHKLVASAPNVYDALTSSNITMFYAAVALLAVVPALVGAFWGAPMVAREVEQGTHLLVWNQSITRTRWLATKFGVTFVVSVAVIGTFSAAATWWSGPLDGTAGDRTGALPSRLTPVTFAMRGLAPVVYAVFALALGVAIGAVIRRTLPAMSLTIGVVIAMQIVVPVWIRPHLMAPAEVVVNINRDTLDGVEVRPGGGVPKLTAHTANRGDWILSNTTIDANGAATGLPAWMGECIDPGLPTVEVAPSVDGPRQAPPVDQCLDRVAAEGYQQRIVYQPADRFWSLQIREAAMFVLLAGLLFGFAIWWTRVRIA